MLMRMLRAYGRRVAEDPDHALADLRAIETELTNAVNLGLNDALQAGKSATELASMLGVSRQAIYKRADLGAKVARQRERQAATTMRKAAPRELTEGDNT